MTATADTWAALSAVASCISAAISAAALVIVANQTSASAKAVGFASAQAFSAQCRELWQACHDASGDQDKFSEALNEILASFELFSLNINEFDLSPKTRDFMVETITDYISDMHSGGYFEYIKSATAKPHVCKELKALIIQHRSYFADKQGIADMMNISRASLS